MSRPTGSENINELPAIILADECERLEYLACLLLEIVENEVTEGETCSPI